LVSSAGGASSQIVPASRDPTQNTDHSRDRRSLSTSGCVGFCNRLWVCQILRVAIGNSSPCCSGRAVPGTVASPLQHLCTCRRFGRRTVRRPKRLTTDLVTHATPSILKHPPRARA